MPAKMLAPLYRAPLALALVEAAGAADPMLVTAGDVTVAELAPEPVASAEGTDNVTPCRNCSVAERTIRTLDLQQQGRVLEQQIRLPAIGLPHTVSQCTPWWPLQMLR